MHASIIERELARADRDRRIKEVVDKQDNVAKFTELMEAIKARDEEIKTMCGKALEEIGQGKSVSEEIKLKLEQLSSDGLKLQARLIEVEQKLASRTSYAGAAGNRKSWGEQVIDHDSWKKLAETKGGRTAKIEMKAVTTISSDPASAGAAIEPMRLPGILVPPNIQLTIRDLVAPGRTTSNAIDYVQEKLFQNFAQPVAEAQPKPQSDVTLEEKTSNVRTLAHWMLATVQVLDDAPQLSSYIDARLRYGLALVEEEQLLNGDGLGQNLLGIMPQATASASTAVAPVDMIREAILQVRLANYRATGIVLHPADWCAIELIKLTDNSYLFANPQSLSPQLLWGLPVVDTVSMDQGKYLVGAFRIGAQIFDRQAPTVEVSTEDSDNFRKNLVTIRAEERLALCVYAPAAFVKGALPVVGP